MILLSRITHWGYRDLMDMDAEELAWWIKEAVDFAERIKNAPEDLNGG